MSKRQLAIPLTLVFMGFGCQTYPDVHPMADGIHKVSFKTERKGDGYRNAMPQAQAYCQHVARAHAVQVAERSEYVGGIDEELYNLGKTASQVAIAVGTTGAILGGDKESDAGAVTAASGGIATTALGLGYEYILEFKCQ